MLKDAFEDYKRHKSDGQENNSVSYVFDAQKADFMPKLWKDIHVGDVIKVEDDGFCPADLLLIASSDAQGTLYVETKSLDGETNLKIKNVQKDINGSYASNQ